MPESAEPCRVRPRSLAVVACLLVAGCGAGPAAPATDTATVTPVAVPDQPTPAEPLTPAEAVRLEPTCERSPGRVIEVIVEALRAENRTAAIETAWQFTAPSVRDYYQSRTAYGTSMERANGELLNATAVDYAPVRVIGDEAHGVLRARTSSGDAVGFDIVLQRQQGGRDDGCWKMTMLSRHRDREAGQG